MPRRGAVRRGGAYMVLAITPAQIAMPAAMPVQIIDVTSGPNVS